MRWNGSRPTILKMQFKKELPMSQRLKRGEIGDALTN
jgi:hypothetical protein